MKITLYTGPELTGFEPAEKGAFIFPENGESPRRQLDFADELIARGKDVAIVTYSKYILQRLRIRLAQTTAGYVPEGLELQPEELDLRLVDPTWGARGKGVWTKFPLTLYALPLNPYDPSTSTDAWAMLVFDIWPNSREESYLKEAVRRAREKVESDRPVKKVRA